jgi:hypothetical protein
LKAGVCYGFHALLRLVAELPEDERNEALRTCWEIVKEVDVRRPRRKSV